MLVTSRDFIQDLVKLIGPKNDPPAELQEKVLSLIQVWSDTFRGQPDLSGVVQVYNELKSKKIEFPPTNYECWAPIHTPQRSVQVHPPTTSTTRAVIGPVINPSVLPLNNVVPTLARLPVIQTTIQTMPVSLPMVNQTPLVLNDEQLAKVQAELETVNGNCLVFDDMLIELEKSNESHREDWELLNELHTTCQAMQKRIVEMIDRVANEEVTSELLRINDVLNSLFARYASLIGKSSTTNGPEDEFASTSGLEVATTSGSTSVSANAIAPNEGTLIDLGDTQLPATSTSPNSSAVTSQLDALTLGAVAGKSSSTVTFKASNNSQQLAQAIGGGDSAFDMFAQMRSDQKKEKSEEPWEMPNEQEVNEMEKWLKSQPNAMKSIDQSDFDRFLEERALNLDRQPNVAQPKPDSKSKSFNDDLLGL